MRTVADSERADDPVSEVEFFGFKLTVRNPRLTALLNSSVDEDVRVVGRRAVEAARWERAEPESQGAPACDPAPSGDATVVEPRPAGHEG
jgi:hypothetical protein